MPENSIFSLFPPHAIEELDLAPFRFETDQPILLVKEGELATHLIIAMDVPLMLSRELAPAPIEIGAVISGRSANLASFIRNQPSPYTVRIRGAGTYLSLPRYFLDSLFAAHPDVLTYFLRSTEDINIRYLNRELQLLNLKPSFRTRFISHLVQLNVDAHVELLKAGEKVAKVLILGEGEFIHRSPLSGSASWTLPVRSWIGWEEAEFESALSFSVVAVRQSTYLSLSKSNLGNLKKDFPEDFKRLSEWVVQRSISLVSDVDDCANTEIDDVRELFRSAVMLTNERKGYPFVKQHDRMDCGPACLTMISQYFEKDLSIQFWRSKLSTGRDGTSFYDLARTAEEFGFITYCLSFDEYETIEPTLLPFICLRKSHFMVVYEISDDFVTVGNSSAGIEKLTHEDFRKGLSDVALFLKPNSNFDSLSESESTWRHFIPLFQGVRRELLFALTCGVFLVLLGLVAPIVTQVILDDIIPRKDYNTLAILIGMLGILNITSIALTWTKSFYLNSVITRLNFQAITVFVQKMLSLPYNYFSSRHVGDFTHRISELVQLRSFITNTLFEVTMSVLMLVVYSAALISLSPKLAAIIFALALGLMAIPILHSSKLAAIYAKVFKMRSAQSARIAEIVTTIGTIKSTGAEYAVKFRFSRDLQTMVGVENHFFKASSNVSTATAGYYAMANLAVMGAAGWQATGGHLTAGKVVFAIFVSNRVFSPLLNLAKQWDRFVQTKMALSRLNDVFLAPSEQRTIKKGSINSGSLRGEIEFRNVWFRYGDNSDWVLRDVNFKILAGEKLAVVGPSGSGKSTIAFLLSRIYEPTEGQILVDGRDYREYDLKFFRDNLGLLQQEPQILAGTIAENIAMSSMSPDNIAIENAAERASILSVIHRKPDGLEHRIPHGGHGFSRGEKQRLTLARLFYSDPQVLILDEATSALDGISERQIMETISRELIGKTVINIVHRYSSLKYSSLILMLNEGSVAALGTEVFLAEHNSAFNDLFHLTKFKNSAGAA